MPDVAASNGNHEITQLLLTSGRKLPCGFELGARRTLTNFILLAILFSANHGCTVSCLSLATARLGNVGAWQSGILYLSYTFSAFFGATYVSKRFGPRNAILTGMWIYCSYIASFVLATAMPALARPAALWGAGIGGIGAGLLWVAEGSYFAVASEAYAALTDLTPGDATSFLGGVFAAIFLTEESLLRIFSTVALKSWHMNWTSVFAAYTAVAVVSATLMPLLVHNYKCNRTKRRRSNSILSTPEQDRRGETTTNVVEENEDEEDDDANYTIVYTAGSTDYDFATVWQKVTAAVRLLWNDPKMKYMIFLSAVFGFSAAFVDAFINVQVVRASLSDASSTYVGLLTAVTSISAAVFSVLFGWLARRAGKATVLSIGCAAFFFVAFPFAIRPSLSSWGWMSLFAIYTLQGMGRATFEGTLRAIFADYFPNEKEGAFANMMLQSGLSTSLGFALSTRLSCDEVSTYCVQYSDGSLHDVLSFELVVMATAVLAMWGYWRATVLYRQEHDALQAPPDS